MKASKIARLALRMFRTVDGGPCPSCSLTCARRLAETFPEHRDLIARCWATVHGLRESRAEEAPDLEPGKVYATWEGKYDGD